jgi:hypothetical protein
MLNFAFDDSDSLCIGGWQPSGAAAPAISILLDRRRWPSLGISFAATGLRRRGDGGWVGVGSFQLSAIDHADLALLEHAGLVGLLVYCLALT